MNCTRNIQTTTHQAACPSSFRVSAALSAVSISSEDSMCQRRDRGHSNRSQRSMHTEDPGTEIGERKRMREQPANEFMGGAGGIGGFRILYTNTLNEMF